MSTMNNDQGTDKQSHLSAEQPPASTAHTTQTSKPHVPLYLSILFLIVAFIGGLGLSAWYFSSQYERTSVMPQPTQTTQPTFSTLIVGIDPTLPPMEYLDQDTIVGYDVDLSRFLGEELGASIEFNQIGFDDLFLALENNEIDVIISAVTITDDRKELYDFSDPYLNAGQVIITQVEDTTIRSTADLSGKRIGVQRGTTNEAEAIKYTDDNLVIRYDDFQRATLALTEGDVNAIFTDLPNAKGITTVNPSLKIASDPFTNEHYGIVLRKNDSRTQAINDALEALRIKGVLADLKQKWLD